MFWGPLYLVGGVFLLYRVLFPKRQSGRFGKPTLPTFDEKLWRVLLCFSGLVLVALGVVCLLGAFMPTHRAMP